MNNQNTATIQAATARTYGREVRIANEQQSNTFMKKIGKANYRVMVHFSPSSKDTFNDKLIRLVKTDDLTVPLISEVVTC